MDELQWQLLKERGELADVSVGGVEIRTGDRVRLNPQAGGDIFDLALAGQVAIIESIEQDYENNVHLAVVLEDDVLMSVTEGEDKLLKYPTIFNTADVAVITKMDIAVAVEFDSRMAHASIQSVRPGMKVVELSAKTGDGMSDWLEFLHSHRERGVPVK